MGWMMWGLVNGMDDVGIIEWDDDVGIIEWD